MCRRPPATRGGDGAADSRPSRGGPATELRTEPSASSSTSASTTSRPGRQSVLASQREASTSDPRPRSLPGATHCCVALLLTIHQARAPGPESSTRMRCATTDGIPPGQPRSPAALTTDNPHQLLMYPKGQCTNLNRHSGASQTSAVASETCSLSPIAPPQANGTISQIAPPVREQAALSRMMPLAHSMVGLPRRGGPVGRGVVGRRGCR